MVAASAPIFSPTNARVSELKVFNHCIAALKKLLGETAADYGKAPWPVVHVAGQQAFRELAREKKNVEFPFLAMIVSIIRPSEEGYNDQALYNGIYMGQMGSDTAQPMNIILHLKPIAVEVQLMVYAQTFSDISDFAQRWMFRERSTQFSLNTANYDLPMKVKFNQDLSIPEEDFSEMGNLFIMQTTLTFYAYSGVTELQPAVTKIQVNMSAANLANDTTIPIFNTVLGKTKGS